MCQAPVSTDSSITGIEMVQVSKCNDERLKKANQQCCYNHMYNADLAKIAGLVILLTPEKVSKSLRTGSVSYCCRRELPKAGCGVMGSG